jgi:hypothetical protein
MFAGLGLVIVALLMLPILGGIVAGLCCLSVPRLRFVSPYCALIPLFSISGLINRRFCEGLANSATLLLPLRVWTFNGRVACLGTDSCSDARRCSSGHGVSGICRTRDQSISGGQISIV